MESCLSRDPAYSGLPMDLKIEDRRPRSGHHLDWTEAHDKGVTHMIRPARIRGVGCAVCTFLASTTFLLCGASHAAAAPVRECGNWGDHGDGRMRWGMSETFGAGIFNLTTRRVACRRARRFVRRYRGTDSYYPTWRCREVNEYEFSDIRCKASRGRVIRWQAGA